MNDGLGGDIYTEIDSAAVRDKPHYLEHSTTEANVPGNHYYFKVAAYNSNGIVYSESSGFTLGEKPETPLNAPTSIASLTSSTRIAISVDTITVDPSTTPDILSYNIDIDDGQGGNFYSIFGDLADSLSTTANVFDAVKGRVYRVRYRVRNAVGWSDYSPINYLRAADVPTAPPAPVTVSATASEIVLALQPTIERGGAQITSYELWIDDGELSESFTKVESYDGLSQSFTIELATETSLSQGKIYRLKYLAKNVMGSSEFSDLISASFSDLPAQP